MKKRVGILRGGKKDYENSIKKGGELFFYISQNLKDKFKVFDIFVDKKDIWHFAGKEISPADLMHKVDLVWNVSDCSFSNILKNFNIPVIEINFLNSFLNLNREMLTENIKKNKIKMPRHFIIPAYQEDIDGLDYKFIIKKAREVFEKFSAPWIVRSLNFNSKTAIHLAKTFPELERAIEDCMKHQESILVEEFISGKNVSLHTLSNYRKEEVYFLPIVEHLNDNYLIPGKFPSNLKENLINLAKQLHKNFDYPYYLHTQFILNSKGIYLKNVSFFPELNKESHFLGACDSIGVNLNSVIENILNSV